VQFTTSAACGCYVAEKIFISEKIVMKEFSIKFVCPDCGGTRLVCRQLAYVFTSLIDYTTYEDEGDSLQILCKGHPETILEVDVRKTTAYECFGCEKVVGITDVDVIKFLKENEMLEEKIKENAPGTSLDVKIS
jgi:hypothetical protein